MIPLIPPIDLRLSDIKDTDSFKCLTFIQQRIAKHPNNIKAIDNGVKVANSIGIEKWKSKSNATYMNKLIVEEICIKQNLITVK